MLVKNFCKMIFNSCAAIQLLLLSCTYYLDCGIYDTDYSFGLAQFLTLVYLTQKVIYLFLIMSVDGGSNSLKGWEGVVSVWV